MTDETEAPKGNEFSEDYVKQLRDEAAGWRKKTRELEAQVQQSTIALEFTKRGINADPSWVKPVEGQTITEAVEDFAIRYPQLQPAPQQVEQTPNPRGVPTAMPPGQNNANSAGPPAAGSIINRDFESIKKDPAAHRELRDLYRNLIAQNSHTSPPEG